MVLLLLGLAFIVLTAVGMPISFAVGVSTVFATLLLPGVDNATIVQRMLTAINTFPLLAVIFFVFAGTLMRSEEHTSELQSRFDLVCRLLLEKKKQGSDAHQGSRVDVQY